MKANHASELDKARQQIRALLNLGRDDGATEAEAENALRFARRLMLRHQLSEEDLTEKPKDPHQIAADTEYGTADAWCQGAKFSPWEGTLAAAVDCLIGTTKHYQDSALRRTPAGTLLFDDQGKAQDAARLVFYGPAEDAQAAAGLQSEWSVTIAAMARMRFGGALRGPGRSYAEGFASALLTKARAMLATERQEIARQATGELAPHANSAGELAPHANSAALVRQTSIMEAKRERAPLWLKSAKGIQLVSGRGRSGGAYHGNAYAAGKADGTRANFNHQRTRRLAR